MKLSVVKASSSLHTERPSALFIVTTRCGLKMIQSLRDQKNAEKKTQSHLSDIPSVHFFPTIHL